MFVTKGGMKATLFVVAVLVVSLGMYAAFQVQEADADYPRGLLGYLFYYDTFSDTYRWKDGMQRTSNL